MDQALVDEVQRSPGPSMSEYQARLFMVARVTPVYRRPHRRGDSLACPSVTRFQPRLGRGVRVGQRVAFERIKAFGKLDSWPECVDSPIAFRVSLLSALLYTSRDRLPCPELRTT